MSIQKILTVPNPLLRQKAKEVTKISAKGGPAAGWDKKILLLIKDLKETLSIQENPKGVGLSAPQIGVSKRVFVLKMGKGVQAIINPKIIFQSRKTLSQILPEKKRFMEGCLSVPGFWGFVDRPAKIKVCYLNLKGEEHQREFEGKEVSFFLHEYDHLDGILFIDRILKQKGKIYKMEKDKEGKDNFVEIKLN